MAQGLSLHSGADCYLIDLPNHGHSPHTDRFDYMSVIQQVEQESILKERETILVGHSFGGRVAMALAARFAPRVRGLVVLDISPFADLRGDRAVTLWHAMLLNELLEAKKSNVQDIAAYLATRKNVSQDMVSSLEHAYRQMNIEVVADGVVGLTAEWIEISRTLENSALQTLPTLFIRGSLSPYFPGKTLEQLPAMFNNYRVETIIGATHKLYHEQPERVIELIATLRSEPL